MRLLFLGFGTVGQGLAELLLAKRDELKKRYGLDWKVTGIADTLKGSAYDPKGIDLAQGARDGRARASRSQRSIAGGKGWDALAMAKQAEADVLLEATYTDIKTGEPATSHIRAALERGMHVVTTNKGPLALHYRELADLAARRKVAVPVRGDRDERHAGAQPRPRDARRRRDPRDAGHPQRHHQLHPDPDGGGAVVRRGPQEGPGARATRRPSPTPTCWAGTRWPRSRILANVVFGAALKPAESPVRGDHQDHRRRHREGARPRASATS